MTKVSITDYSINKQAQQIGDALMKAGMVLMPFPLKSDILVDFSLGTTNTTRALTQAFMSSTPVVIASKEFSDEERKMVEDYGYEIPVFMTDGTEESILAAVDFFLKARKPRVYTMADIEV